MTVEFEDSEESAQNLKVIAKLEKWLVDSGLSPRRSVFVGESLRSFYNNFLVYSLLGGLKAGVMVMMNSPSREVWVDVVWPRKYDIGSREDAEASYEIGEQFAVMQTMMIPEPGIHMNIANPLVVGKDAYEYLALVEKGRTGRECLGVLYPPGSFSR